MNTATGGNRYRNNDECPVSSTADSETPQGKRLSDVGDRRQRWTPPPRPDWVRRLNEEGACMDIKSVVPLDENSLLATAMANTGCADFGEDSWREPFQVFIRALDEEAELNLMGRLMTRSDILLFLEARLLIEDAYKRHPEIDDEQIVAPLLVTGQGRSGTSYLLNLLSAHPDNGTTRTWECMFPCPPPNKETYATDPRIERADKLISQMNRVTPELASMHEFSGEIPAQSDHIQSLSFRSVSYQALCGQVPAYYAYIAKHGRMQSFDYEKRALKLLQWKNPRKHWVLKAPDYLMTMRDQLQVYPDARIVWVHRDPILSLSSVTSLLGTLNWVRTDNPYVVSWQHVITAESVASTLEQPIAWLHDGSMPRERLCNLQYRNFVAAPIEAIEEIYAYFGEPLAPAAKTALLDYVAKHPREKRPPHRYYTGDADTIARERIVFRKYQEYFGVSNEV